MLGMAVGTGNIWRFPRIVARNGGGSFLVAWVVFLLLWSIPLILVEFSLGKATRSGTVGAFGKLIGKRFAWMGAWVGWCATASILRVGSSDRLRSNRLSVLRKRGHSARPQTTC